MTNLSLTSGYTVQVFKRIYFANRKKTSRLCIDKGKTAKPNSAEIKRAKLLCLQVLEGLLPLENFLLLEKHVN